MTMISTCVVVDDLRSFVSGKEAIYLRTSQEAIEWLQKNKNTVINELWLDYDLGLHSSGDGDAIANYVEISIKEFPDKPHWLIEHVYVHTSNPSGADRLMRTFQEFYRTTRVDAADCGLLYLDEDD